MPPCRRARAEMHCVTRAAPAPAARAPVKVALELWEMGGAEVVDATYVLMRVLVVVSRSTRRSTAVRRPSAGGCALQIVRYCTPSTCSPEDRLARTSTSELTMRVDSIDKYSSWSVASTFVRSLRPLGVNLGAPVRSERNDGGRASVKQQPQASSTTTVLPTRRKQYRP